GVLIDKVIVEKLYDPLLHLIRNAYDHGLESPDIRRQQDKSETGQITIRAYHQGNRTTIEVNDDGQGLNWERIRDKAIAKDLLTPGQAASASEAQLAEVLFEPGFSTTEKISQLSGRGIGLDVVRSQLQTLQGSISVNSVLGQGTTFVLQLPINLTTARLLICESQGIVYALLSEVIDQVLLPQPNQIQHQQSTIGQNQQTFLCWGKKSDQQLIPISPLTDLINYQYPTFSNDESTSLSVFPVKPRNSVKPLLMLKHQQQRLCLQVDQILVEQELVIKSFGNTITLPNYIQGYSVLGDGSLTLVIDLAVLVTQARETNLKANSPFRKLAPQLPSTLKPVTTVEEEPLTLAPKDQEIQIANGNQPSPLGKSIKVLVVDDSVVQRQTLTQNLTKAGYKVLQAANGQEALAQLNQHSEDIQLVICDVEMPYMNGFEFLSHWRQDTRFSEIPVMMLTTRSGPKHRHLAIALGAKVYFTKPCSNQELLETVAQLIEQPQNLVVANSIET
nr:response regulator [Xenococcaceae cyanobacterium MO_234.B1]